MALTNYILRLCVQKKSDVEAIYAAEKIAEVSGEWVEVEFRYNGRVVKIGPNGEILLPAAMPSRKCTTDSQ